KLFTCLLHFFRRWQRFISQRVRLAYRLLIRFYLFIGSSILLFLSLLIRLLSWRLLIDTPSCNTGSRDQGGQCDFTAENVALVLDAHRADESFRIAGNELSIARVREPAANANAGF